MNSSSTSPSKFRSVFKWGLISLAIVAAIWLAVIIWWQTTHRVVTLDDTLLYLAILPLTVLAGLAIFQLIRRAIRGKNINASSNQSTMANGDTSITDIALDSVERTLKLPVLAAWGVTSLASNAEDFLQELVEKRERPRPDEQLLNDQGFPLLSGRVTDLDTASVHENLMAIIAKAKFSNIPDPEDWRDAFLRALALLGQILDQVQTDWPLPFDTTSSDQHTTQAFDTLRGAAPSHSGSAKQLSLYVKLLIPAHFQPYEQQLALTYLLERMADFHISKEHLHIDVVRANDDATVLALADQFSVGAYREGGAQALLLLACDSTLCTTVVEDWQTTGRLFSEHCPSGLMMGEAAFGILCASDKSLQVAAAEPVCHLTRVSRASRDTSADAQGKPSHACLTHTVSDALTVAGISGAQIGTVACDTDHRTNRTLECMGTMMAQTPQLDAIQNRLAANEACGHLGAASVAGILVAGIMQAKNEDHAVLLFNVSHATDRAAAVLIPPSGIPPSGS